MPPTSSCVQWYLVRMYTQQKNKQTGIAQLEESQFSQVRYQKDDLRIQ